jgi:archaetidylinositol phosphate synthase
MPETKKTFTGDRKAPMRSPLAALEKQFIESWVGRFPPQIESYHLTLATVAWSLGLMLFGFLAKYGIHWLWFCSILMALQWFTDSFDGAIGRRRDTGLARWGFYMDHFLDFVFMTCAFAEYAFIVNPGARYLLFLLAFIYACMMVSSFLAFGATGEFKITYLGVGPTEVRILFILLNTLLIFNGPALLERLLPLLVVVLGAGLVYMVVRAHAEIWAIDMREKAERKAKEE